MSCTATCTHPACIASSGFNGAESPCSSATPPRPARRRDGPPLPDEDRGYYQTLGGFVMMHLERTPVTGDRFDWSGNDFEVVDMDGNRVDKVLFRPAGAEP